MYDSPNPNGNAGGVLGAGEVPPAVPAVVAESGGVAVERRQVGFVDGDAEGQAGRGVDCAEEDVGKTRARLTTAVPGLDDGGHRVEPLGGDDRAAGLDDDHGARVGAGDGTDELDVSRGKPQRGCGRRRR